MPDLTSGQYSTSLLNQNFADQEQEFLQVLYRVNPDGRDNSMQSDIDMNSQRILNLPDALQNNEPVTLQQATQLTSGANPAISYYNNVAIWVRAPGGGSWSPGNTTSDIVVTFQRADIVVATHTVRGSLDVSNGNITIASNGTSGEATTLNIQNNNTPAPIVSVTHDLTGVISSPVFLSIQGGATGAAGSDGQNGTDGQSVTQYYIKPVGGTAIKNGVGTLTVEARAVTGSGDTLISAGSIQLYVGSTLVTESNGYFSGSNGYTGIFDSGDINDSTVVELKDSPTGTVLDTITLIDVQDGVASNATTGSIEVTNGLAWSRLANAGAWEPSGITTDLIVTFYQAGSAIATETRRITLNTTTGTLSHALEGVDDTNISVSILNDNSTAITVIFTHDPTGVKVSETVTTTQSGSDGGQGPAGSDGTNGTNGADGADGELYYIKPTNGTAIRNGTGTLTIEAHHVTGAADTLLSSGTIRLYDPSNNEITTGNGYATGSDGFTGVFDSGDISGDIVITLKDGVGGTPLDTITLVDIADGVSSNATSGSVSSNNGLVWNRAVNNGAWNPSTTTTDLTVNFYQAGSVIATEVSRVTLNTTNGTLSHSTQTNDPNVTVTINGGGTSALTLTYVHVPSGHVVSETVASVQSGQNGADGADGADGVNAQKYYIQPTNGTAIKNGVGSLVLKARLIDGTSDTELSSGTIQLYVGTTLVSVGNGYAIGSNGYTGNFDSTDINNSVLVELKDGPSGTPLDTITLVDIQDGVGTDAIFGSVDSTNGLAFTRATNAGTWSPVSGTTDITGTFYQGGTQIASDTYRVTLNISTGGLTPVLIGANDPNVNITTIGSGTSSLTLEFTHVPSGVKISETIISVQGGSDGSDGTAGTSIDIQYSPDGISGWHNPPFVGTDNYMRQRLGTGAWSAAMKIVGEDGADGEFIDYRFTRTNTQPGTPLGNTPLNWSDDPGTAPGTGKLWMTRGRKSSTGVLIGVWSTPIQLEGSDGASGQDGSGTNLIETVSTNASFGGSASLVHPSAGNNIELSLFMMLSGDNGGSQPGSQGTVTITENGSSIFTRAYSISSFQDPEFNSWVWDTSSNFLNATLNLKLDRQPGSGNVTYACAWSGGTIMSAPPSLKAQEFIVT